jgi:hypothetical protein
MSEERVTRVVNALLYDTDLAFLIARSKSASRKTYLYVTGNERYFSVVYPKAEGEEPTLTPLSVGDAVALCAAPAAGMELLMDWEKAFPDWDFEDA